MEGMEVDTKITEENTKNSNRKLNKTILDNFSNLVKPHEGIRIKSSVNLLKYLSEDDSEKVNELNYALGRIIRGLGSSSTSARTGFYTVLVAILNFNGDLELDTIFSLIEKHLQKAGSHTKSENADIATGQILACGAVIRSRLWPEASLDQKEKILTIICKASKERVYLGLLANNFIIQSFENLPEKKFQKLLPVIKDEISKPWHEQSIDSVYLLNEVKNKYPNVVNKAFLTNTLGTSSIVCEESLEEICKILLAIPRLSSLKHPFYNIISKEIASNDLLKDFTNHLDGQLASRNRNKLIAAAKIYTEILNTVLKTSHIPSLLSKNFVQHVINYFRNIKDDEEFYKNLNSFFEALLTTLKKDGVKSKTKISVLRKLLFFPGTFVFEKVTKSKIVQNITANLDDDGVKNLATLYRGVVAGTERIDSQDEHWLNNDRLYAAHLLVKMLNLPIMKDDNDWKVEQLCFLVNLGLLKGEADGNVGSELAGSLKSTFYGALDLKLSKLDDLVYILSKLFNYLNSKLNKENLETVLRSPITEDTYEIWLKTAERIAKIEKKRKRNSVLKTVFITLFLQMGLQLLNDTKLATDSLNELFACYEKSRKSRKESTNSLDDTEADETQLEQTQSDPLWIEVVVDLFLNLLSHQSHLLRHLVNCVFPHLCHYMTPAAIHQILSVLDPKNEDNPLSNRHSDSSDEDNSESDDDNEANDKEEAESQSEESEEEEEGDDNDDEKETVNEKLRIALHEALMKNGGYKSDEESVDLDNLSETEGKELDKALAAAFRQHKPNRGKQKKQNKDEETLTHFRIRVLDLIEIYINSNPSMHLCLEIMLPLLQAVEFTIRDNHQTPLHNRLKSCLKKLTSLKKFSDTEGVDDAILSDLLRSLLEKGTKTTWIVQDMSVEIAMCCTFIIRCSDVLSALDSTPKKVKKKLKNSLTEIVLTELDGYFHKRDSLTPIVVFKNVISLSWDGCISLIPPLLQYVFDENVKQFKQNQALDLLRMFYQNQRFLSASKEKIVETLRDHHAQLSENVLKFFNELNDNSTVKSVKEKFVANVFNLLTAMKTCCLAVDNIDWSKIGEVSREYRSTVTFSKDAKKAFNKFANRLGISNIVKMKPKAVKLNGEANPKNEESTNSEEVINNKKKMKKTKNKEKLKLKKEAKQMRLQSLSEGLGGLDFTEVDPYKLREDENEDNDVTKTNENVTDNHEVREDSPDDLDEKSKEKQKRKKRKNNETGNDVGKSRSLSKKKKFGN